VDPQTHKKGVVHAFVMTLRFSRHQFVYWCVNQDEATWCQAHVAAFAFFGGVPHRIVLDNLKDDILQPDLYDPVSLSRWSGACAAGRTPPFFPGAHVPRRRARLPILLWQVRFLRHLPICDLPR
jgi:hypothetical protein